MSKSVVSSGWAAWVLSAVALLPFFIPAIAIWVLPGAEDQRTASWVLAGYATAIIIGMNGFRLYGLSRKTEKAQAGTLIVAAATPLCAIAGFALTSFIGFRWGLAILVGALASQGVWDLGGEQLPDLIRQAQPPVAIGAVIALLIGFIGN